MNARSEPQPSEPEDPELKRIAEMDRPALVACWVEAFGCPAPRGCGPTLLRCAVAWHYQMSLLVGEGGKGTGKGGQPGTEGRKGKGASTPAARAGIDALARRLRRATHLAATRPTLSSGTRLIREWQGKTHHVTVLADGFEYAGKTWKSLSAIARDITGTAWSGPAFFDVKKRGRS